MGNWLEEHWLSLLIYSIPTTLAAWWQYHNLLYLQGKRKHPFFKFGKSKPIQFQPMVVNGKQYSIAEQEVHFKTATLTGLFIMAILVSIGLGHATGYSGSGQGTGFGRVDDRNLANFPPPNFYQQLNSGGPLVSLVNAARDDLILHLESSTGAKLTLKLAGCPSCKAYGPNEMPECGTVGQWTSFMIPPGNYQVVGEFWGVERIRSFRSAWTIAPGGEYRQCLYQSTEMTF